MPGFEIVDQGGPEAANQLRLDTHAPGQEIDDVHLEADDLFRLLGVKESERWAAAGVGSPTEHALMADAL